MNTPVTYNVPAPAPASAPASASVPSPNAALNEKKESSGVLGFLSGLFGGSETPSTNAAVGGRRRTRKGKGQGKGKGKGKSKGRKVSRRNHRK